MCNKAVDTCLFAFESFPDQYMTQELRKKTAAEQTFMLKYCHNKYKTQEMYDKVFESYLLTL